MESAVRLKRAGGHMGIVKSQKNLTFEYIRRDEDGNVEGITKAVDNVSIDIKQGEFCCRVRS